MAYVYVCTKKNVYTWVIHRQTSIHWSDSSWGTVWSGYTLFAKTQKCDTRVRVIAKRHPCTWITSTNHRYLYLSVISENNCVQLQNLFWCHFKISRILKVVQYKSDVVWLTKLHNVCSVSSVQIQIHIIGYT